MHLNINNIETKENKTDTEYCLICWEPPSSKVGNDIFKMKHITLFKSECKCNCTFHLICFFKWVEKTYTCPICREKLTINNAILEKYRGISKNTTMLDFFENARKMNTIIKIIFKYVSFLFLLYISIKIIIFIVSRF